MRGTRLRMKNVRVGCSGWAYDSWRHGIYQGVPLSDRSSLDPPLLPDKITIFAAPLLEDFPDPEDLHEEIRLTVLHEIAHYFGMDEEEIEDLGY